MSTRRTPRIRTRNARTRHRFLHMRVNDAEYAQLQRLAGNEPITSEWLRGYLLGRAPRADFEGAVLAELRAAREDIGDQRAIVLSTLGTLAGPKAEAHIREFTERARREKAQRAMKEAV